MAPNGNSAAAGNSKPSGFAMGATAAVNALGATVATAGKAAEVGATAALKSVEIAGKAVNVTANVSKAALNTTGKLTTGALKTTTNVGLAALNATSVVSQASLKATSEVTKAALEGTTEAAVASSKAAGQVAAEAAKQGAAVSIEGLKGAAQVTIKTTQVATQVATDAVTGLGNLAKLASLKGDAMVQQMEERIQSAKAANSKLLGVRNKEVLMMTFVSQFNDEASKLFSATKDEMESNQNTLNILIAVLKDNYCLSFWRRRKAMFNKTKVCPPSYQRDPVEIKLALSQREYKSKSNYLLQVFDQQLKQAINAMQLEGKKTSAANEKQEYQDFLDLFNKKMADFAMKIQEEQKIVTELFTKLQTRFITLRDNSFQGNFNSSKVFATGGTRKRKPRKQKKTRKY